MGCERQHYQALTEQAGDCDAFGREGLLDSLEDVAVFGLACAERDGARLLVEVDERRRAVDACVQHQLHYAKGDVDDGGIGAVQQRATKPQGRVWPPRAAQTAAESLRVGAGRRATLDLCIDGMHDGLSRARRLLDSGRGCIGGADGGKHLVQMLHQLMQLREPLRWQLAHDVDSREVANPQCA